jgi:predicted TPR repeat methyltransferase
MDDQDPRRFEQARAAFTAGLAAHADGRAAEAEALYLESLRLLPGRASTLANLGAVLLQQGRLTEALERLDASLDASREASRNASAAADASAPGAGSAPPALAHRAEALMRLGRDAEALAAFEALLEAQPSPRARLRRAECLARLGRQAEALPDAEALCAAEPGWAEAWRLHGQLLRDLGHLGDAAAALTRAGQLGDALASWLAAGLATARDAAAPARPPEGYVEALFDAYAADFDRHLVDELEYDAPQRLALGLGNARFADALDLGCGTGLVGRALRGRVDRLEGVDLSSAMLTRARATGDYARLVQADLVDHLLALPPASQDLVVAADVLIYLGELDALFAGVRRVLRSGGVFTFTVEHASEAAQAELRPTARYAHAPQSLHALAARHGLRVEHQASGKLRLEQGQAIAGLYFWLRG